MCQSGKPDAEFDRDISQSSEEESDLLASLARQRSAGFMTVLRLCYYVRRHLRKSPSTVVKSNASDNFSLTLGRNARTRSARSPSVSEHYATLTWVAFDFDTGVVGRCTFSTPSRNSAVTFVLSASSGSVKLRRKVPKDRSMRWNFFFSS